MAENPRIGEKRLPSSKSVQVGATDADAMHADEGFSRTSFHRSGELFLKLPRLIEYDLTHQSDGISFSRRPSFLLP
jgi:hypothetical protein